MSVSHKAEEYGNYPATLEEFVGFVVFLTHTIHSTLSVTHSTMSQKFISHIEKFHTLTRDSMIRSTKQYIKHYTYRHTVHHGWGDGCWFTLYRSSCIEKEQNAIEELKTTFVSNLIRDLMKIWRVVGLYDKIFMIEWISKMIPFRLFLSKLWDGIMRYEKAKHKREVYYKKYQSEAKSQVKRSEGEELEQRLRKWNESKNKTRRFVKYQDEHDYEDIECQLNKKRKKGRYSGNHTKHTKNRWHKRGKYGVKKGDEYSMRMKEVKEKCECEDWCQCQCEFMLLRGFAARRTLHIYETWWSKSRE